MNLLRRRHETHFREPRLLDSRTPGVAFEMTGSTWWKARRTRHPDIEAIVRDAVVERARIVAIKHDADDLHGAQDAINTDLGPLSRTRHYSDLRATVVLRITDQARADALQYRHSIAHIERLRFLKQQLYSDPAMLMLDYLDKNPGKTADPPDLAQFEKLALKITNGERWWCWVIDALDRLSAKVSDEHGNLYLIEMMFAALQDKAPDLFNQHSAQNQATYDGKADLLRLLWAPDSHRGYASSVCSGTRVC
jgi:hypothetical protein